MGYTTLKAKKEQTKTNHYYSISYSVCTHVEHVELIYVMCLCAINSIVLNASVKVSILDSKSM